MEMLPSFAGKLDRAHTVFFEEGSVLGHQYVPLVYDPVDARDNMNVSVLDVIGVLDARLGLPDPRGPPVLPSYFWQGDGLRR